MKYQVGDLFVYTDSMSTIMLYLVKIRPGTLYLEFPDKEGKYVRGPYDAYCMTNNYLKNGSWYHFPVKT